MKLLIVLAGSLLACRPAPTASPKDLEARVKKLEESLARREEALSFLEKAYAQQKQAMEAEEEREHAPDAIFAIDIQQNLAAGLVEGPATAPVTIVEAFDFACPFCQKVNTTLEELVQQYGGKVRVVYKNFVVHPDTAMPGHLGSCAAAKQNKYTAFKNAFWEKAFTPYAASGGRDTAALDENRVTEIAKDVGLDLKRFATDMHGTDCKALIAADMAELEKFQVGSTPTLFVNGTHVAGALPKRDFEKLIEEKIALAEKSGVAGADYYQREILGKGEKKFRSKKDPKPQ